jgi:DNA-binding CsgD family transcriptional regulator
MSLTQREREVLCWIAQGKSDWQIGQILRISAKTVNYHAENAKRKLGVATRIQAVLAAIRSGALEGREPHSLDRPPSPSACGMDASGPAIIDSWAREPVLPPRLA